MRLLLGAAKSARNSRKPHRPLVGLEPLEGRLLPSTLPAPASYDNPATIDLLALYTPAAANAAGGADQLQAQIQRDVADTNEAFGNSRIYINLRLVDTAQVSFSESNDLNTDLTWLRNNSGALRDNAGTDLVAMYVAPANPNYGGLSKTMVNPADPTNAQDKAFSVVVVPQQGGVSLGLAHEIGHDLGAGHDAQTGGNGAFSYSHGYRFSDGHGAVYRTIMAYAPGTPIRYFSSADPGVNYLGLPVGNANADNARTLNQTAPIVAAYRPEDTIGPTASLVCTRITNGGGNAALTFQVQYADNLAIDASTLSFAGIYVSGPGVVQYATYISASTLNGTPRTVTYAIQSTAGYWSYLQNGDYSVSLVSNPVYDTTGHPVALGSLGTMHIDLPSKPNLSVYRPAGWSGPVVVSTTSGVYRDAASIAPNQSVYVSWAVHNANGGTAIQRDFVNSLYVDGVLKARSLASDANHFINGYQFSADFPLGKLAIGTHTLKLVIDSEGVVGETDKSDNTYTRTIVVKEPDLTPTKPSNAPVASVSVSGIKRSSKSPFKFKVTYTGKRALKLSSIGTGDVLITGPKRFSSLAKFITAQSKSKGRVVIATYSVKAPGGAWDAADNGTYNIKLRRGQVSDSAGKFASARTIGKFAVSIAKKSSSPFAAQAEAIKKAWKDSWPALPARIWPVVTARGGGTAQ